MTVHKNIDELDAVAFASTTADIEIIRSSGSSLSASSWIKSFRQRIVTWLNTAADYYAAATLYDELHRLSDAELQKRGLSRGTLARVVCSSCDPTDHS